MLSLYAERQIRAASDAKFAARGTTLAAHLAKAAQRKLEAATKDKDRKAARRAELVAALGAVGVELRHDSRLCRDYIDGSAEAWPLGDVVARMTTMHVLYEHSRYSEYQEDAYAEACDDYDEDGREEAFEYYYEGPKAEAEARALRELRKFEKAGVFPNDVEVPRPIDGFGARSSDHRMQT